MRLLRLAIEERRWDLAAHTLILAAARLLNEALAEETGKIEEKINVRQTRKQKDEARPEA